MALLSVPSNYENDRKLLKRLIVKSLRVVLTLFGLSVAGFKSGRPNRATGSSNKQFIKQNVN